MYHRSWLIAPLLLCVVVLSGACSGDGQGESATPIPTAATAAYDYASATEPGAFGVGQTTLTMIDASRPTAANGDFPGSASREMRVEVWYPAAEGLTTEQERDASLEQAGAPYPLIIFAHGLTSSRVQSTNYVRHLASHGYIVAAPDFPLTNAGAPGGPRFFDTVNQPEDVSFVIDEMLEYANNAGHRFAGAIDAESIGLTGHSGGAFTTLLTLYGDTPDDRIDAAAPLSGTGCILTESDIADVAVPVMLISGSNDLLIPADGNRRAYDLANAPKYWVELVGGSHVRFADADIDDAAVLSGVRRIVGSTLTEFSERELSLASRFATCELLIEPQDGMPAGITIERQQEFLRAFATPFFDAYLRGDEVAKAFLQQQLPELTEGAVSFEFDAP